MAITVVQQLAVQSDMASGGTISLPSPVTAGNHQILEILHSTTLTITVTDSLGNTVTQRVTNQTIHTSRLYGFTIPVASTGSSTLTITFAGGTARRVYLREVSDLDTSVAPLVATNGANTANPVTSGSVTPTRDGALISSYFIHSSSTAGFTAGSGLTERHDNFVYFVQDGIQTTAAAINPEATAAATPANAHGVTIAYTPNVSLSDTIVVDDEPSNSWTGEVIRPPVVVNLTTDGSTIDTGATDTVTAAIATGTGTLSGTTSVAAVAGVATFSNLIVTGSGSHTLTFTATGYTADTSASFKVATGTGVPGGGGGGPLINGGLIS